MRPAVLCFSNLFLNISGEACCFPPTSGVMGPGSFLRLQILSLGSCSSSPFAASFMGKPPLRGCKHGSSHGLQACFVKSTPFLSETLGRFTFIFSCKKKSSPV